METYFSIDQFAIPAYAEGYAKILLVSLAFNLIFYSDLIMVRTFKTPLAFASRFINTLEMRYNRPDLTALMLRNDGVSTATIFAFSAIFVGLCFDWLGHNIPYFWIIQAMALGTLFNLRSYLDQSRVLADALDRSVEEGRATLALVSGRDTENMDAAAVARTAVETSARALSSGLLTPAFYFIILGSGGLFLFKTINIASMMIDERSDDMKDFGWGNARLNEMLLYPGGWFTGFFIFFSSLVVKKTKSRPIIKTMLSEAKNYFHKGAGTCVAAMAGALSLKLGGPIYFEGDLKNYHWVGQGSVYADSYHIRCARILYIVSCVLLMLGLSLLIWLHFPLPVDVFI